MLSAIFDGKKILAHKLYATVGFTLPILPLFYFVNVLTSNKENTVF